MEFNLYNTSILLIAGVRPSINILLAATNKVINKI